MRFHVCRKQDTPTIIDLGKAPLANSFLDRPTDSEELFDLKLVFCPVCKLVQITEAISPQKLFQNYAYFSSMSQTMQVHVQELVDSLVKERNLGKDSLVIEIASNDGYLLQHFNKYGVPTLGIDPAENVAEVARKKGVETLCEFFGDKLADTLPKADVMLALNVLGHVPEPTAFVRGLAKTLRGDGVCVIEVPWVRCMIEDLSFDTVYFEHMQYYSLTALKNLFSWHGLQIAKARFQDIHGGSLRLYVEHYKPFQYDRETNRMFEIEEALGVHQFPYYQCFSMRVRDLANQLKTLLQSLREQRKRVVAFGAAAKGTMLLNYIGANGIEYVVDSTPAKIGKYMPGVHLPVLSPYELGNPDYVLLTAWNWANEIMAQRPDLAGRFILPVPTPRIV